MRYSYEENCPVLFVSITVSGEIWLNSAGPSNQFTALLVLLSLHSSIYYTHSILPSIPWQPSVFLSIFFFPYFSPHFHSTCLSHFFLHLPCKSLSRSHTPFISLHLLSASIFPPFLPPSLSPPFITAAVSPPIFFSFSSLSFFFFFLLWNKSQLVPPNHFTGKTQRQKRLQ